MRQHPLGQRERFDLVVVERAARVEVPGVGVREFGEPTAVGIGVDHAGPKSMRRRRAAPRYPRRPMTTQSRSFERIADEYDATRGGLPRGEFCVGAFGRFLPPASTVLEVGVGTGAVALPTTEAGHDVLGVDLATAMLARAYARIGARVAVADAHELPVASQSVDAAVTVWVLHVVGDPARTVREIARVLRPGGRWIVISSDAVQSVDDMEPAIHDLDVAIGRFRDAHDRIRAWADAAGLRLHADIATDPVAFPLSPN